MRSTADRSRSIPLEALIFDVDGTLAETEEVHRRSFNQAFAEAGCDWMWSVDAYTDLLNVTGGKERIAYFIERVLGDAVGAADRAAIAALHQRKTAIYAEAVENGGAVLRSGIEDLVRQAHAAGLKLAIATTTSPANVESLINATFGADGLSLFTTIAAGDVVAAKKPAADIYRLVLNELKLEASHCLAIEDSRNGLEAALGAAIPTLITRSIYTKHQSFDGALCVIDALPQLIVGGARRLSAEAGASLLRQIMMLHSGRP